MATESLKIPLSWISESGHDVDATVPGSEVRPDDVEDFPIGEVRVRGTAQAIDEELIFRGEVTGTYQNPCDRCLQPVNEAFNIDVIWSFEEGAPLNPFEEMASENDEEREDAKPGRARYEGSDIDLRGPAWEEIVLGAPPKFLCAEECAGLCVQCGANLNTTPCACEPDTSEEDLSNQGFSGLADMFPDLKSNSSED